MNKVDECEWIQCLQCGKKSYNIMDRYNLYCGYCGMFHSAPDTYIIGADKLRRGGEVLCKSL